MFVVIFSDAAVKIECRNIHKDTRKFDVMKT